MPRSWARRGIYHQAIRELEYQWRVGIRLLLFLGYDNTVHSDSHYNSDDSFGTASVMKPN